MTEGTEYTRSTKYEWSRITVLVEMIPARMWNYLGTYGKNEQGSHWVLSSLSSTHEPPHREDVLCLTPAELRKGVRPASASVGRTEWDESLQLRCPVSRLMWWTDLESGHPSRSVLTMKMIFVQSHMKKKADIPLRSANYLLLFLTLMIFFLILKLYL